MTARYSLTHSLCSLLPTTCPDGAKTRFHRRSGLGYVGTLRNLVADLGITPRGSSLHARAPRASIKPAHIRAPIIKVGRAIQVSNALEETTFSIMLPNNDSSDQ
ncbi:hypothetical protein [Streptomyces sp. NPDC127108]|uniref:hypothetical protein n=1 Tax=Streptomyces sp. NPDC127108 TaxID=3345361 RepID=UPI00363E9542